MLVTGSNIIFIICLLWPQSLKHNWTRLHPPPPPSRFPDVLLVFKFHLKQKFSFQTHTHTKPTNCSQDKNEINVILIPVLTIWLTAVLWQCLEWNLIVHSLPLTLHLKYRFVQGVTFTVKWNWNPYGKTTWIGDHPSFKITLCQTSCLKCLCNL